MIHHTCIIDKEAKISKTANIGAYTVIGPSVEIGDNVYKDSHVNIAGNTKIGAETNIPKILEKIKKKAISISNVIIIANIAEYYSIK